MITKNKPNANPPNLNQLFISDISATIILSPPNPLIL